MKRFGGRNPSEEVVIEKAILFGVRTAGFRLVLGWFSAGSRLVLGWFSAGSQRVLGGSRRVLGKFLAEFRQDLGKISRLLSKGSFIGVLEGFASRFLP